MVELVDTITLTLEKMNVDTELVEPKSWEQLKKIESVLSEAFKVQEELKNAIKDTRPSVNKTATKSNIARQTFYNNNLLKQYTEFRISEYNNSDPIKKNEKLLERIAELENKIKLMSERDVSLELMRRKITLLENNLKSIKKENKELHEKYNNLKYKNKNGNNDLSPNNSKVTIFPNLK
ncbi:myosin heavy subunit [Oikeobacillus pervagus]|uniref:Myosin heavy subunit n=1 Tax=Oikeobacillus pervagus TaxID=1325931 RepID=A0AAJ1T1N8_9BACI|nr:hypothetical protein [Oikeobacillus pervagus]MDQ0215547.1 myosin heavy subunit [Oikeobacillus pervagus]